MATDGDRVGFSDESASSADVPDGVESTSVVGATRSDIGFSDRWSSAASAIDDDEGGFSSDAIQGQGISILPSSLDLDFISASVMDGMDVDESAPSSVDVSSSSSASLRSLLDLMVVPLDPPMLETLTLTPEWLHSHSSQTVCVVCTDDFETGVEVTRLPCNHIYHPHCIHPWLLTHPSCPTCRLILHTAGGSRAEYKCFDLDSPICARWCCKHKSFKRLGAGQLLHFGQFDIRKAILVVDALIYKS